MLRKILLLLVISAVSCQYQEQRAPPMRYRPAPEEYAEEYAPPPRQQQAPPQQSSFAPTRPAAVLKPASVHYVNIGLELAGDYKFGYDTGKGDDQSFREETRLPDGTVQGAYGYVDETGRQRIVKYTAGKEGFKVVGDDAAPAARAQPAPAPQQAYRAPPPQQASYAPEPAAPRPQPQPAYRPPPQAQPAYRAPPQAQPAYNPPPQPQPRPAYRAPAAQPAYSPEPEYRPQPRSRPAPRPARPVESYDETPDYDYPNNEIGERRLVPVDTALFNYNIGTSQGDKN